MPGQDDLGPKRAAGERSTTGTREAPRAGEKGARCASPAKRSAKGGLNEVSVRPRCEESQGHPFPKDQRIMHWRLTGASAKRPKGYALEVDRGKLTC